MNRKSIENFTNEELDQFYSMLTLKRADLIKKKSYNFSRMKELQAEVNSFDRELEKIQPLITKIESNLYNEAIA